MMKDADALLFTVTYSLPPIYPRDMLAKNKMPIKQKSPSVTSEERHVHSSKHK